MTNIKKETFNSGFLSVIERVNGEEKTLQNSIPFGVKTVTENRFNAALFSGNRIDKVLQVPYHGEYPHNAYVKIGDKLFTIWKQQPIQTTSPPINVLTLKEYE